jgi:predicted nucleotidyltransferase
MQSDIDSKREALAALCRRFGVTRLEVFGSAARGAGFDPKRSDADFLVTFAPAARNDLTAFADLKDALGDFLGALSTLSSARPSRKVGISSGGGRF